MRAVLRNLESCPLTTKNKPSAFYDSEPPYAARVIRLCLMWEGFVLLYRNFIFKVQNGKVYEIVTLRVLIHDPCELNKKSGANGALLLLLLFTPVGF